MKRTLRNGLCLILAILCLFCCFACVKEPEGPDDSTDPTIQQTEQTPTITLAASTLQLPEESAFILSFFEADEKLGGIKSARPTSANAYLNDLILDQVQLQINSLAPSDSKAAALDVLAVYQVESTYSFEFLAYYDLSDGSRKVAPFFVSTDFTSGTILTLGNRIRLSNFENGNANEYVPAYLAEHFAGQYQADLIPAITADQRDGFYVSAGGATLVYPAGSIGNTDRLSVYIGDAAISQYRRTGTTPTEAPADLSGGDYQPAGENEKVVAMTFDDGPGGASTARLLDYLEQNNIKATFFINARNVANLENSASDQALLQRMVSLNCEVGNHSYSHPYFSKISVSDRIYQVEHNAELIEAACGVYPNLFRAPGGIFMKNQAYADDYFFIDWTVDGGSGTEDWRCKNDGDGGVHVANAYLNYIGPGSIVLMHDIYENSVSAAIIIMSNLKAQGYRFVTVSELLDLKNKVPDGTIYTSQTTSRNYMSYEQG